ncbi:MAG: cytochrome C oxidase subunit IV family protein [Planctomycetes bacterium]|nr:cytochrome C oxidase subunit IV family protein [Planctomycetota bacterium]MCB9903907.1 cytochrome C oxidase subunit IV family protein [Planctomycetota bacterium]
MSHEEHAAGGAHVMSPKVLLGIWGALIFLTALTVWSAQHDLGRIDLVVAMGIATIKASLVALYFMHLRYDKGFHGVVIIGALVFVFLFVSMVLLDRNQYQADIDARTIELEAR